MYILRSIPASQLILSLPFPPWYPCLCYLHLCLCFCFVNKIIYNNVFRFPIYVLICSICSSVSDSLPSIWQSLGLGIAVLSTACYQVSTTGQAHAYPRATVSGRKLRLSAKWMLGGSSNPRLLDPQPRPCPLPRNVPRASSESKAKDKANTEHLETDHVRRNQWGLGASAVWSIWWGAYPYCQRHS